MKRFLVITTIFALSLSVSLPALAQTEVIMNDPTNISTGFTRSDGGGVAPIVKAKWEANLDRFLDDATTTAGAQFLPSGQFEVDKSFAVCAVVTDPDGVADINAVYADTFYPVDIFLGDSHEANRLGCGQLMSEVSMTPLTKAEGFELFCNKVKNQNNNLPTFNGSYDYSEICNPDGELMKETAKVYCGVKELSYEDPSGSYRTLVLAQDKAGVDGTFENHFDYLPLTAFETDFASVSYGSVKLNTHKIINGDLTWGTDNLPTVRNVGNTRLSMNVKQDDMGLGMTDGLYNVEWDARVGSSATFAVYPPEQRTNLSDDLDLSETDEMDFSILIKKFPPTHDGSSYTGNMTLCATTEPHLSCQY